MRRLLPVIVLAFGTGVAQADNGLFYFGVGVTRNNADTEALGGAGGNSNQLGLPFPNVSSTSWDVFAGFRPISLFAVEADYFDLGSGKNTVAPDLTCGYIFVPGPCVTTWQTDAKAYGGYAVGFLPIPLPYLDVYGKVGVARYELHGTFSNSGGPPATNSTIPYSDNSTVFAWGLGVQAHIGIIGGRLEYAGFDKASTSVFSLSVFLNL